MAHGDITHIDIPADDLARAQQFYGSVFGWQISEVPGYEGYPMWRAPNGISGGGIARRQEGFTSPRSYVEVDSIEATIEKAKAAGGRVVVEKSPISETSWYAAVEDTEGNQMGLYEGTTEG
ncbi:MAG TPA: VOC family protein [Nocardioidaceae bacterium]|nr:VOC family protein [Nocardioidaceae bacterium]